MTHRDLFLKYNKPFQWLADKLFDPEKYFVFSPWCQRIGHQLFEITAANCIAKRDNKILILIPHFNPTNKEVFNCIFNCEIKRNGLRYETLRSLLILARLIDRLYNGFRFFYNKISFLPNLPYLFFHPRYGIEKGSGWRHRLKGSSFYWDFDLLQSADYKISLTEEQLARGNEILQKLGIPKDSWFVVLHVREHGYLGKGTEYHNYRDACINNYIPTIRYITSLGGYVIRIGDPTMRPIQPLERFIDYAHSAYRSDLMDLYLTSQARFLILSDSGPLLFATLFKKPNCRTNLCEPYTAFSADEKGLSIFKHIFSIKDKRFLTFKEVLAQITPLAVATEKKSKDNFIYIENTPEEILESVKELWGSINSQDYLRNDAIHGQIYQMRRQQLDDLLVKRDKFFIEEDLENTLYGTLSAKGRVGDYFLKNCWEYTDHYKKMTSLYNFNGTE